MMWRIQKLNRWMLSFDFGFARRSMDSLCFFFFFQLRMFLLIWFDKCISLSLFQRDLSLHRSHFVIGVSLLLTIYSSRKKYLAKKLSYACKSSIRLNRSNKSTWLMESLSVDSSAQWRNSIGLSIVIKGFLSAHQMLISREHVQFDRHIS